jgi:hypothetical protein
LRINFVLQHLLQRVVFTRIDCMLRRGNGNRRRIAQTLRQFESLGFEFVRRHDTIHQSQLQSLLRVDRIAQKEEFRGDVRRTMRGRK